MTAAPNASESVLGARSSSSSRTGMRVSNEKPSPGQPYLSPATRFAEEAPVLRVPGLVEAELPADLLEHLRRRGLAGEADRRVSGRKQVEDRERDHRHDEQDDDHPDQPTDDVGRHRSSLSLGKPLDHDGKRREGRPAGTALLCLRRFAPVYCATATCA